MHMLTTDDLVGSFAKLGIEPGDQVLVHSSLSSLGHVQGGAEAVVEALIRAVGASGTVLVPTLTGSEEVGPGRPLSFDVALTKCWTGAVPESLRARSDAVRSRHPTHSVAAVGASAPELVAGHEDTITPCGLGSPYRKLTDDPRGKILLLGVGYESNTTLHAIEEAAAVDYHLQSEPVRATIRDGSVELTRTFWAHAYGTPRRFEAIEPLLTERGFQRIGPVGASLARLVEAGPLFRLGCAVLRLDPNFLVASDPS